MPVPAVATHASVAEAAKYDALVIVGSSPDKCSTGVSDIDGAIASMAGSDKTVSKEGTVSAAYGSAFPGGKAFYSCAGPLNRDYGELQYRRTAEDPRCYSSHVFFHAPASDARFGGISQMMLV